jgi:hypothetical protein
VDALLTEVYRDTVDELRRVADFAARDGCDDVEQSREFAVETALGINERDNLWNARVDALAALLDARGARIRTPGRTGARE